MYLCYKSFNLTFYLFIYLSVYLLSIYLSVYLSTNLCILISIYLSIYLSSLPYNFSISTLGSQPPEEKNGGDGEEESGEDLDARVERLMAAQANIKAKHF